MPVPEERMHNPPRLNRWFALASILMTASFFWMIDVDYNRPWREIQDSYYVSKAAFAHLDYLDATREDRQKEIEEARQRVADAREMIEQTKAEDRARLQTELAKADFEFRKSETPFSKASQVLDVTRDTYERRLGEFGPQHPETVAAREQFQREEEQVESLRKTKELWEDERRRLELALRDLEKPIREAEKRLSDLEQVAAAALKKDQDYRGVLTDEGLLGGLPIVKTVINAPLGDFVAPKNTPGRHQVNQLVLPNVRQRLNYLETYTTDRCTTCHVAIDDPEFAKDKLARKLEKSLPGINEALQRMGDQTIALPEPPIVQATGEALPEGAVTDHWDELTVEQQNAYFDALLTRVNAYFERTGRKTIQLGNPVLAHPDLDLFVSVDSAHPMAQVGCTVCHEGNPQETDFVLAAHTPPTHEVREDWEHKYYVTSMGLPNATFDLIEHYWDRPMRLPQYTQGGCAKCHHEVADIAKFEGEQQGSRINLGQHLFREVGCVNCHNVETLKNSGLTDDAGVPRKVAPDLTHMASKLRPEFVQQWVWFPQGFRPSTRMPHFFMQENNNEDSKNQFDTEPMLRTQTEVAAMSKYLFAVSKEWAPIERPESVSGDVERGRQLFTSVGCLGCHSNLAEYGEQWITADLKHQAKLRGEELSDDRALNQYKAMSHAERVRYAMEHFPSETESIFNPAAARFNPDREYNRPMFSRFAPELSGIGSKVNEEWLYSWLIEPTHYAPETKMPSLRLSPTEAADITAYLMTLKNEEFKQEQFPMDSQSWEMADQLIFTLLAAQRSAKRSEAIMRDEGGELSDTLVSLLNKSLGEEPARTLIGGMSLEDKKLMYLGSKMIGHYGCYACHKIRGFEDTTPPGTDLTTWAEKPITQLDFAFYDHAFHHMREEKEEIFGYIYPPDEEQLNLLSPLPERRKEQVTHTHAAFGKHKVLNPRIWDREKIKKPYDKLKMPNFYFDEEESEALTTYLLSLLPSRVTDELKVDYDGGTLGPIAKGRILTRELNCIGCHELEDNAPVVQQYFLREMAGRTQVDATNAPPRLWGEGAKVQHNWLHRFLQHVDPLRPWLQIRMPTFNIDGEQATTLVEYFAALSKQDAAELTEWLRPVNEYIAGEKAKADKAAKEAGGEVESAAGADWFRQESLLDEAANLRRWGIERQIVRAAEVDPLLASPERLPAGHKKLLGNIEFLRHLYDVQYPFVEPPSPLSPEPRYQLGKSFTVDMGCLKCHVLGPMLPGPAQTTDQFIQTYRLDGVRGEGENAVAILNGVPYPVGATVDGHKLVSAELKVYEDSGDVEMKAVIEGPGPSGETERVLLVAPSAPNLGLTAQRLRRTWVHDWMLDPQLIQPGTKMPTNFGGGVSPFEGDERYPGTGSDHINLLVDFLFDSGTKADRVPVPKIEAAEAEEFEEGGEAEEFED